jgi:hypothetical protein
MISWYFHGMADENPASCKAVRAGSSKESTETKVRDEGAEGSIRRRF